MITKRNMIWRASTVALACVLTAGSRTIAGEPRNDAIAQSAAAGHELALTVDASQSKVNYTLDTTLHTVHGTFALKRGTIRIEPDGKASGEIVADATSGQSGDSGRDKKMHKDVLESAKYTEVVFRPDRVDGEFPSSGAVSVQMHGKFELHGSEHEMMVPVKGEITGDHWHGTATMKIPYVEWGLKSPNSFILKADPVVEVELELVGAISKP
ncbi:MAG TPA: YceI family protein [Candidatus Eremiobacteraceae bacterium]|jgi:polyisoprenoid-binding protein YceI|nr:YceI family protein [Candidatus Eremiobacteraceae bacterium]